MTTNDYNVSDVFADAPVPADCVLRSGLVDESEEGLRYMEPPIFIAARKKDLHTRDESLTITWLTTHGWEQTDIPRAVLVQKPKCLQALATKGCPVTEHNIKDVQKALLDFEQINMHALDYVQQTEQMGWLEANGEVGFMHGSTFLASPNSKWKIEFRAKSSESLRVASGFHRQGTLDGWKQSVACAKDHPRLALTIYASLSSVLVKLLNAANAIVDFSHPTSTGKTSILMAGASVWGQPREDAPDSIMSSWNASPTAIQAKAAMLANLPSFFDDTKRVMDDKKLAAIVYDISGGQSAARGKSNGQAREMRHWQNTLISTGEAPLTSLSKLKHGGQHARVLEITGAPFGKKDAETAKVVHALRRGVAQNFGHAGPMLVQHLLDHPDRITEMQREFDATRIAFAESAGGNSIAGRLGEPVALLSVTARLAHEVLELPWDPQAAIDLAWGLVMERTSENTLPYKALTALHGYAERHRDRFYDSSTGTLLRSPEGRWDSDSKWSNIALLVGVFDDVMQRNGLDASPVKAELYGQGYLDVEKGRTDKKVSIGSRQQKPRMIVIKRKAFEDHGLVDSVGAVRAEEQEKAGAWGPAGDTDYAASLNA